MKPNFLKVYHALPSFAKNWAASAHGYMLNRWRYSPETDALVAAALEREKWSPTAWETWRADRLTGLLKRAAQEVPYYRQYWEEQRRRGNKASFEILANWPILVKEPLRRSPELFLADDCERRKMHSGSTSGTTGTPLQLWCGRPMIQHWYALNEARIRRWHGVNNRSRWGHVGGQPVVAYGQERPPYWVWNSPWRQLYLSAMHISPQSALSYLSAIKQYRLEYLLGYPSSITLLAQAALESRTQVPLKFVLTDSEPLLRMQRSIMEEAFGCPVRETYGMGEIACAASECPAGKLHIWPEVGIIELLDESNQPVAPGQTGRVVTTSLLNADMPLIRYDTLDLAQADPDSSNCACGRSLPRLLRIVGRNDDVIVTKDGRRLYQVDRIFEPCFDIREAQIVQEDIGRFVIRVAPGTRWSRESGKAICEELSKLVGEAEISVELVPKIERTWAGKFKMIVSHVPLGKGLRLSIENPPQVTRMSQEPRKRGDRMAHLLERSYRYAPAWLQNVGVSLFGLAWRTERLGGNFEQYVSGFRDRDRWSPSQMQAYVNEQLRTVLLHAHDQVPYYRRVWTEAGLGRGDLAHMSVTDLPKLPVITKRELSLSPEAFVAEDVRARSKLKRFHSSGSTGTPITAICTVDAHRRYTAGREARSFRWAGTSIRKPRSMIGGRLVVPRGNARGPFHRYNWVEKQVYFSAFHIAPANVREYVRGFNHYRPRVMTGYAYSHYILARMMAEAGVTLDYEPDALVLSSEKLTPEMKVVIRQAFRARAYEEYGATENCMLATECEHGSLHVNPDFGIIEIVDAQGQPVPPGVEGRILCTALLNEAQPLVRYEIGDLGVWAGSPCPCGRNHLPVLKEVVGRLEDVVVGPDGRQMVRFHGIFIDLPHVLEGQVIQEAPDRFTVKVVGRDGFGPAEEATIRKRFVERLGMVSVEIHRVHEIPRTARGKFRAVIRNF